MALNHRIVLASRRGIALRADAHPTRLLLLVQLPDVVLRVKLHTELRHEIARHGYVAAEPFPIGDGPPLYPMLRQPR